MPATKRGEVSEGRRAAAPFWQRCILLALVCLTGCGGGGAGSGADEGFSQEPPSPGMRSAPRARPAAAAQPAASMNEGITDDDVPF